MIVQIVSYSWAERNLRTETFEAFTDMALAIVSDFVDGVLQSQLLDAEQRDEVQRLQTSVRDTRELAQELLRRNWLTAYQVNQIFQGKGRGLILGPFILLERIGEGGMGQVFKARQKMLNRNVALKVIRKECLHNPKVILRFQREIRAAGQLSHPHIVRAYDADQVNGTYYIAMEYIEGVDLAKLVRDNGPLPVDQACEYIRQAALGLQHAFERGMVHRDIKPANLLVSRAVASDRRRSSGLIQRPLDWNAKHMRAIARSESVRQYPWGIVKILDMGLARCTDPFTGRASTHLTQIGSVMGTPEFIAPEQARDSHTSDIRADLYSLGCTLYFLLTGHPPFPKGTLTEKLLQHQLDDPPPVGSARRAGLLAWQGPTGPVEVNEGMVHVPAPVEELLRRLLSKRPQDRYQTPVELANALQAILLQLADGTLSSEDAPEHIAPLPLEVLSPDSGAEDAKASATTRVMPPLIRLAAKPRQANWFAGKIAFVLASMERFASLTIPSGIAALLSRDRPPSPPTTGIS
jgi:serine/threonine protein kinase